MVQQSRMHKGGTSIIYLLFSFGILPNTIVHAIITKVDPQQAIIPLSEAKFFVSLFQRGDCAGSVVSESYVVTAGHCVCGTRRKGVTAIDYNNRRHAAVAAYGNPDRRFDCRRDGPNANDVAVLQFARSTFVSHDARRVYEDSDEVGKIMWIMGMGIKGRPDDFPDSRSCRNGRADSSLRDGYNVVDQANGIIVYDMTQSGGLQYEAIAQDGDSGGPALIQKNGDWMVAGVNSGTDESNSCDWGSKDQYCRLSEHATWIRNAMDDSLDDATRGMLYTWGNRPPPGPAPTPPPQQPPTPRPQSPVAPPTTPPPTPQVDCPEETVILTLRTDDNPEETMWMVKEGRKWKRSKIIKNTAYGYYKLRRHTYVDMICVPRNAFLIFRIYDKRRNGISGDGGFTLSFNGEMYRSRGNFGRQDTLYYKPDKRFKTKKNKKTNN